MKKKKTLIEEVKKKNEGYVRQVMAKPTDKRLHKKIQRYGYHKHKTLVERMVAEGKGLAAYQKRVGQIK